MDAETGELHQDISDGQRAHDLYTAEINLFGELSDLEEGGLLDADIDPLETIHSITARYEALWKELTAPEEFHTDEMHRLDSRIRRLNELAISAVQCWTSMEEYFGVVPCTVMSMMSNELAPKR